MEEIIQKLKTREIKRSLFIRLRSIGDTVLLTPAIKAFKSAYPHCYLAVLIERHSNEVLVENPHIDELIIFDRLNLKKQSPLKALYAQLKLYLSLMNKKFDIVFNFHGGSRSLFLTLATLAKYRIGLKSHRFSFLYSHVLANPKKLLGLKRMSHAVENQYALIMWAGAKVSEITLDIPSSAKYREGARRLLEESGIKVGSQQYIVAHPYTPNTRKAFPISYVAKLIDHLSSTLGIKTILTYGPGERGKLEEIVALTSSAPILLEAPIHLMMVAELIRGATLFVGCDSGTMHIAAAVGTPVAALFNGSNCRRWHPWCKNYFIIHHHKSACERENCQDRESSCIDFLDYDKIKEKIR